MFERLLLAASPPIQAIIEQRLPYIAVGALVLLVVVLSRVIFQKSQKLPLPYYYVKDNVVTTLEEAHRDVREWDQALQIFAKYMKHPDGSFALSLPGQDLAVLADREIDTIKSLPESEVSIKKHHYNVFLGEYSYMGTKADEFDSAMRHVLTRNTPTVLNSFTSEIEYAMDKNVGECEDWTPVTVRKAMSRAASILSGRAFVGLPLSRDEAWIEATVNYTADVSRAWLILRFIPWPIRPIVAPFLPQVRSLLKQKSTNVIKLAPLLAAKQSGVNSEKDGPGGEMMDWFISQYKRPPNAQQLGRDQLLATFASIYNLSNALTYIPFDLAAADPQVITELRQELLNVVGENGTINKANIANLRKLDSFARESQRLSPPSLVNIPRIVTNPGGLKLSTGEVIPKGTLVMIISHTINRSPKLYPNPSHFNAFRFFNLRQKPGNELKYQHATTGTDNINFGHGLWACPGRFFAAAEIKVVAAYILKHYDIKLMPGEEKPSQQHWGLAVLPNPTAQVLFKRRKQ